MLTKKDILIAAISTLALSANAHSAESDFIIRTQIAAVCDSHEADGKIPHFHEGEYLSIAKVIGPGGSYFVFEDPEDFGHPDWKHLKLDHVRGDPFPGIDRCESVEEVELQTEALSLTTFERLHGNYILHENKLHTVDVYLFEENGTQRLYVRYSTDEGGVHAGHVHN